MHTELKRFVGQVAHTPHEEETSRSTEDAIAELNAIILGARVLLGKAKTCEDCKEHSVFVAGTAKCRNCYEL